MLAEHGLVLRDGAADDDWLNRVAGASAVSAIAHDKPCGAARHLERDQGPSRAAEAMTIGRL